LSATAFATPTQLPLAPDVRKALLHNAPAAALFEQAIQRGEGKVTATGGISVLTGLHTGRSAADKFIVKDDDTAQTVWWENAKPLSRQQFDRLHADFIHHAEGAALYVQDLFAGADTQYRISVRVFCEYAWHALFIRHMMIVPEAAALNRFVPHLTIIDLPSFRASPERHGVRSETVIACDFSRGLVLIGGTSYAGEIKKSVFSYLNYALPARGVMPMHCSVNEGKDGNAAIFFGLSGTGKTTLSTDPGRRLIGDDEHGWSPGGIYNFEGGCYAKAIRLSAETEPGIHHAVSQWGTVLENVLLDSKTRMPDFASDVLTENTRAAYPLSAVENVSPSGITGHPKHIVMLMADAFGVLPPIARLSPGQAMFHFLSGYTAKVAGTEKGVKEPAATFSTCFGAPFMSLHPTVYGNMLRQLISNHDVKCWLVNTGWTGGKYGVGRRMPLPFTRALIDLALSGRLDDGDFRRDPLFGFEVPVKAEGFDSSLLNPRETWSDKAAYDSHAQRLAAMFNENFAKFAGAVESDVSLAAPVMQAAE
jgi:phosphoenolpyruvate carboxykinase (ATP)